MLELQGGCVCVKVAKILQIPVCPFLPRLELDFYLYFTLRLYTFAAMGFGLGVSGGEGREHYVIPVSNRLCIHPSCIFF